MSQSAIAKHRDPCAQDADAKIKLAAAAGGVSARDDGSGDRKIHAAAAEAGRRPYDDGAAGDRKIRAAAGQSVGDELLAKALSDLGAVVAAIPKLGRSPRARRLPARTAFPAPVRQPPAGRPPPLRAPTPRPVATPVQMPPLRFDSQHGYWDFRDRLAGDIRSKRLESPNAERIVQHAAANYGIGLAEAAEWTERFMHHLQRERA